MTLQTFRDVLTLEQQFCQELSSRPQLDSQQERILIERARSGDTAARNELIISLIPPVKAFVRRFLSNNYQDTTSQWEFMDLVQEGTKAMLEAFAMESLDAPLPNDETETVADLIVPPEAQPAAESDRDFTPLYQAIEQLTPRRKEVVIRSYGLYYHAPEQLRDLAQAVYGDAKRYKTTCHDIKTKALDTLRHQLQEDYPQYGTDSIKPCKQYAYERLTLTDARRKALTEAEARLQARGEKINLRKLTREAKIVPYPAVQTFLKQQALPSSSPAQC
jgi:DNA-directed RNA polymerase sigma subunit (sigma70/sigma32)